MGGEANPVVDCAGDHACCGVRERCAGRVLDIGEGWTGAHHSAAASHASVGAASALVHIVAHALGTVACNENVVTTSCKESKCEAVPGTT
jgi:hypothetical protein